MGTHFRPRVPRHELSKALNSFLQKGTLPEQVIRLMLAGQLKEVRSLLEQVLAIDPNDTIAHFNMGSILRNLGDLQGSLEHYQHCEKIFDDIGNFYTNRARTYEALGQKDKVIADYKKALELMPGDLFTLKRLEELESA